MEPGRVVYARGYLAVVGPPIDAIVKASIAQIPVPSQTSAPFHMTVATKDELRQLPEKIDDSLLSLSVEPDDIINLGVGGRDDFYFNVIIWIKGTEMRREMGLPPKQFHITLSEKNNHCVDKGVKSILEPKWQTLAPHQISSVVAHCKLLAQDSSTTRSALLTEAVAILHHLLNSGNKDPEMLDLLAVMLYRLKDMDWCLAVSMEFMSIFPDDPRGYFRAAAYYSHVSRFSHAHPPVYSWKLAMLLYGEAVRRAFTFEKHQDQLLDKSLFSLSHKLAQQACQAILQCAKETEYGCPLTRAEVECFPEEFLHLAAPWNREVRNAVLEAFIERGEPNASMLLSLDSRERLYVYDVESKEFHKLPRFFRWITPFRVAAMSTPKNFEDIRLLVKLGIGTVVTLTKEEELNAEWFTDSHPTRNVFVPVINYKSPTIAQIDYIFEAIDQSREANSATLVHCGGGKGRAGTVVACYLVRYGFIGVADQQPRYTAGDIIKILRHMRPGSIETDDQEQFVARFVKELWKRAQTGGKLVLLPEPEPEDCDYDQILEIEGRFNPKCKLIVCCGIPGSGKSTVSKSLAKAGWTVASQDETGSRKACAAIISAAARQNKPVIVDRCNPTVLDRKEWIDVALASPSDVTCLFFDYDEALCLQRANLRLDHPTLVPGSRCMNAVRSMSKNLQRPTMAEGFGTLVTIRNFAAANNFVQDYCGRANSVVEDSKASPSSQASHTEARQFHKFPRTRHLFNFGAATREDLLMTKAEAESFFLGSGHEKITITLEEKVDGANLGFSIDPETQQIRAQNRSHYVNSKSHSQFKKLNLWIEKHLEDLMTLLTFPDGKGDNADGGPYILYGEWLQATHSIPYTRLPDYFLAFDLYDVSANKFWSRDRFLEAIRRTTIQCVPQIQLPEVFNEGVFKELMGRQSAFSDGKIEGVYVRRDKGLFLLDRSKVVRNDFMSGNVHWSKHIVMENVVRWP